AGPAGAGDEVAPLGGVVQTVHVSVGQVINEGDKLVSLEAMKMVTHVIARRGGKVISIAIKAGDPVDAGQVLLTIG
ncbi:MAG: oxaloacetate decarboxylase, partial [Synechococcaceae cyanobacterium SM1_2_3]|nr:oxaloacetate decarboxylase [Synechococcaceae cyanobacterium SM1_2_3]